MPCIRCLELPTWETAGGPGQARSHLLTQLPQAPRQNFDGLSSLSGRLSPSRQTSHPFYPGRNPSEILERECFSGRDAPRLSHNPDLTVVAGSEIIISNLGRSDVLVGVGGQ